MKRFLTALLVVISLGLCAVCMAQWQREFRLREAIAQLQASLIAENKLRVDAEQKVEEYGREIERLTTLRSEIEARLTTTTEELRDRTFDQLARGYSIALLMNETLRARGELSAARSQAGQGSAAIQQHNAVVTEQNAAIAKANAQIRQLVAERDEAIAKLNARTVEFNELVEKYNKLGKSR